MTCCGKTHSSMCTPNPATNWKESKTTQLSDVFSVLYRSATLPLSFLDGPKAVHWKKYSRLIPAKILKHSQPYPVEGKFKTRHCLLFVVLINWRPCSHFEHGGVTIPAKQLLTRKLQRNVHYSSHYCPVERKNWKVETTVTLPFINSAVLQVSVHPVHRVETQKNTMPCFSQPSRSPDFLYTFHYNRMALWGRTRTQSCFLALVVGLSGYCDRLCHTCGSAANMWLGRSLLQEILWTKHTEYNCCVLSAVLEVKRNLKLFSDFPSVGWVAKQPCREFDTACLHHHYSHTARGEIRIQTSCQVSSRVLARLFTQQFTKLILCHTHVQHNVFKWQLTI